MGHIPNFTKSIFPDASIPNISTVANLGLIMFLFIVGMEVDLAYVRKNLKVAASVGLLGMAFPFAIGWAVAVGLYDEYGHDGSNSPTYGVYGLFVAVALSITALPVLARILTELRMLRDRIGVIVLSAGIGNDLAGWILLALTVTLANNSQGIRTLYVILLCIGWFILLYYIVRPILRRYLLKFGGIEKGPSQIDVSIISLLIFCSAFYTDLIGVHPIFGAFLTGIAIPRDNDFVVKLTEKIEDFVTCLILPQYFALAGLNCNVGSLNDGTTWGYVVSLIMIAFVGKFVGGTLGGKFNGLLWREASAAGVLMSCKGIVEIVVLTVGLSSNILTEEVYTMFIVMTLFTTVLTTPLTILLYPEWYRLKVARWRNGEINWDGTPKVSETPETPSSTDVTIPVRSTKFIVHLDDIESISVVMTLIQLLSTSGEVPDSSKQVTPSESPAVTNSPSLEPVKTQKALMPSPKLPGVTESSERSSLLHVFGIRLIELTQRTADLIQATSENDLGERDPILAVVNTFTAMHRISFAGKVAITPLHDRASLIVGASSSPQDFLLMSWHDPIGEWESDRQDGSTLDFAMFREVFRDATCNIGLFVDRGFSTPVETGSKNVGSSVWSRPRQIYVPYLDGSDDKLCIGLAFQLADNPGVQVIVDVILRTKGEKKDDETIINGQSLDYASHVYEGLDDSTKSRIKLIHSDADDVCEHIARQSEIIFKGGITSNDLIIIGRVDPFSECNEDRSSNAALTSIFGIYGGSLVANNTVKTSLLVCQALESVHHNRPEIEFRRSDLRVPKRVASFY